MKKILKNFVKHTLAMFAIGAALGVAVPAAAALLGPELLTQAVFDHLSKTPVLQTGIFFGVFGAVSSIVNPIVNRLFGEKEGDTSKEKEATKVREVVVEKSPAVAFAAQKTSEPATNKFREMVDASRVPGVQELH